jgi:hypothetical protein
MGALHKINIVSEGGEHWTVKYSPFMINIGRQRNHLDVEDI